MFFDGEGETVHMLDGLGSRDRRGARGPQRDSVEVSVLPEIPELVTRALRAVWTGGYVHATRTETGRLLATLAATRDGTIAECGSGVGAAWLRCGAPSRTRVISAAPVPLRGEDATEVFGNVDVEVIATDFEGLAKHGPFSLLVLAADCAQRVDRDSMLGMMAPGGIIVIDDLAPSYGWPPRTHGSIDTMRLEWLTDSRVESTETQVAEDAAVLVAVRRHTP